MRLSTKTTHKYDEKEKIITRSFYDSDGSLISINNYDEMGNITETAFYFSDGSIDIVWKTKFDDNNNIVETAKYNSDQSVILKNTREYKYDDKNNWVNKVHYINEIPKYIIERQIEYFD